MLCYYLIYNKYVPYMSLLLVYLSLMITHTVSFQAMMIYTLNWPLYKLSDRQLTKQIVLFIKDVLSLYWRCCSCGCVYLLLLLLLFDVFNILLNVWFTVARRYFQLKMFYISQMKLQIIFEANSQRGQMSFFGERSNRSRSWSTNNWKRTRK